MSRGISRMTRLLVEVIEDRVGEFGSRDRTPLLDDIYEDYRKAAGIRTKEAQGLVDRRLDTALGLLEDDEWSPVKVTSHYAQKYKGAEPNHPDSDVEIVRCVAGGGSGLPTYAIHFCVKANCVLFIEARIRGMESGEAKIQHQIRRMNGSAEAGNLTTDGIETIVTSTGDRLAKKSLSKIGPRKDIRQVHRIAGRLQQSRLALQAK